MDVKSIGIICNEHRLIAAVLHGMRHLVREIRVNGAAANFELFGAMIYYIDAFPERFHHPKENEYLFRALRRRHPGAHSLLDRLEREHYEGADKIRVLEQALARYQQGGSKEFPAFAAAVGDYSDFHWSHMRTEEMELLPLAREYLTAEDWEAIEKAFLGHGDPLLGVDVRVEFETLFTRICNLAPPPIGVGPVPGRSG